MKLHRNDEVIVITTLEDIPGTLTVIGCDDAGEILASSELTSRNAFLLTARLRRVGWFPQGTERLAHGVTIIYAKTCIGLVCQRCEGTGLIPHYGHIDRGRCFACNGTGKPIPNKDHHSRNHREIARMPTGTRLRNSR
jgi:hypothetical protein